MESLIMTQLNIPVTHLLIPQTKKTGMNGSWLKNRNGKKGEQQNKMKTESK